MKAALAAAATVCVLGSWIAASAQEAASRPAAASGPSVATRPALSAPDIAKGCVDPYDAPAERERFFKAAGVDGELTRDEFNADAAKDGGFVRGFDNWQAMLAFDKDSNGRIDWFEADAYRQDIRKKVMDAFDKDKDGKLAGDERELANRFLLSGRVGWSRRGAGAGIAGAANAGSAGGGEAWLKKYDTDGDGKLSDAERQAALADMQEQARRQMLEKYDANGDGQIDAEERKAMQEDQRAQQAPWKEQMEQEMLRHFDVNDDGKLDDDEKAAADAFGKELQKVGKEWELATADFDGDGKVSPEERKRAADEWRGAAFKIMAKSVKYMDADGDGDGKVSPEESQAFQARVRTVVLDYVDKLVSRADADGDDRLLTAKERSAFVEALRGEMAERRKRFDADGDGRLNPSEVIDLLEDFARESGLGPKAGASKADSRPPEPSGR